MTPTQPHAFQPSRRDRLTCDVCGRAIAHALHTYTLPGMDDTPTARAEALAEQTGRHLTRRMLEPALSIDRNAREMLSRSPLFRGSEADPQNTLF